MSHENHSGFEMSNFIESQSFDPNKFERVETFIRLENLCTKFYRTKNVTEEEASKILEAMDTLAHIGYFATDSAGSHRTAEDLERRGIDPDMQAEVEEVFIQRNMAQLEDLLRSIYAAEEIPPTFIEQIVNKVKAQKIGLVSGAEYILQALYGLDAEYKRDI